MGDSEVSYWRVGKWKKHLANGMQRQDALEFTYRMIDEGYAVHMFREEKGLYTVEAEKDDYGNDTKND